MPLIRNQSKEAFGKNVSELINAYKKKGKIGSSSPKSKAKARKQALAIAFDIKGGK
jgi:(p)ppGpp synthase/HD superfamily hydrolase